ncbi:hypothetical protein CTAYLR_007527 [Chrysophaeum taylorii]|uniref:Cyclic nucleotide-binding domain-containing protein n=1 Tax=Chrysophaeum taylorii TaxID=2483200 RepID=A0AAD7U6H4_9STRA|nr:hypothetical protein CTAYLR_007527 [Chrysophaeum taylorii]
MRGLLLLLGGVVMGADVVMVRIQKTGTLPLVAVLKECSFGACGGGGGRELVRVATTTRECHAAVSKASSSSSSDGCFLDGFCPWDTVKPLLNASTLIPGTLGGGGGGGGGKKLVITMLREPADRVLSEYAHVCGRGAWDYATLGWRSSRVETLRATTDYAARARIGFSPKLDCENASGFESFLVAPAHANGMRNRQTRMLAGARMFATTVDARPESVLYAIARDNLDRVYDVVLVFEHFQESLVVLARRLGIAPPRRYAFTQEEHLPRLDRATRDLARRFNYFDTLLHEEASKRLHETARPYVCAMGECALKPDFPFVARSSSSSSSSITTRESECVRKRTSKAAARLAKRKEDHHYPGGGGRRRWCARHGNVVKDALSGAMQQPRLFAVQTVGAVIVLYSYSETDVLLLRFWAVTGLVCYSIVPNAFRGNLILTCWGLVFVSINGARLYELVSERAPVQLNYDEQTAYETSGFHAYVTPSCFKRLAATADARDLPAGTVLKTEEEDSDVVVVLSGSVALSTFGKRLGTVRRGAIIGVPDLAGARDTSSHAKVRATVADRARVLSWRPEALEAAMRTEKDPNTELQLVKFFAERLMDQVLARDHRSVLAKYRQMLAVALRDADATGSASANDKAALLAFRRANAISREEHIALLGKHGWSLEDWQVGTRSTPESQNAALLALSRRINLVSSMPKDFPPKPNVPLLPPKKEPPNKEPPKKKNSSSSVLQRSLSTISLTKPPTTTTWHPSGSEIPLDEAARRISARYRKSKANAPPPPPRPIFETATTKKKKSAAKLMAIFEPPPPQTSSSEPQNHPPIRRFDSPLRALTSNVVDRLSASNSTANLAALAEEPPASRRTLSQQPPIAAQFPKRRPNGDNRLRRTRSF